MDTLDQTDEFYPYVKEIIQNQSIVFEETSLDHPTICDQLCMLPIRTTVFWKLNEQLH